jgi:hypothetical protein
VRRVHLLAVAVATAAAVAVPVTAFAERSVHCSPSGDPSARQQTHGIQTGCQ